MSITKHKYNNLVSFQFKLPSKADYTSLNKWILLISGQKNTEKNDDDVNINEFDEKKWMDQILSLAQVLMHDLGVPSFEPLRAVDCKPIKNSDGLWHGSFIMPQCHNMTHSLAKSVIETAESISHWLLGASFENLDDVNYFYSFIEKQLRNVWSNLLIKRKSTFELLRAAHQLGIPVLTLNQQTIQLGWGSKARRINGSFTDGDSFMGAGWASNKFLASRLLHQAALPAPESHGVQSLEQAEKYAERLGFPVVIKPIDRERGEGVTVDVTRSNVKAAYDRALRYSRHVLVERQIPGTCHRLFISNGQLLYAVKRLPIGVYGDGKSTINQLVEIELRAQQILPPWKRSKLCPLDSLGLESLSQQGWKADSVVPAGTFVALRRIETTMDGGVDEDVTDIIHPHNVRAAIDAAALFGLEVAGVDMISRDISKPWHANGAVINEVNFAPLLGGGEISRRYIKEHITRLISDTGRIPVHLYVGGDGAWNAARDHWQSLRETGVSCYLTNEAETFDGNGDIRFLTSAELPQRLMALLVRRDVEALVLALHSVESLFQIQLLDRISTLTIVDHDLRSEKQRSPTANDQDIADLLTNWERGLKIG